MLNKPFKTSRIKAKEVNSNFFFYLKNPRQVEDLKDVQTLRRKAVSTVKDSKTRLTLPSITSDSIWYVLKWLSHFLDNRVFSWFSSGKCDSCGVSPVTVKILSVFVGVSVKSQNLQFVCIPCHWKVTARGLKIQPMMDFITGLGELSHLYYEISLLSIFMF